MMMMMRLFLNIKRSTVAFSIILMFLCAGCMNTSSDNSDQPKQSATGEKEESNNQSDKNASENSEEENNTDSEQSITPPNYHVSLEGEDIGFMTATGGRCWETDGGSCSIDPPDVNKIIEGSQAFFIEKGKKVTSRLDPSPGLPRFDQFTITQYRQGEEKIIEHSNGSFAAPEEPGRYNYLVHFQWDGEVVGEAYYGFSLAVRGGD
jgi:hypothetical protein